MRSAMLMYREEKKIGKVIAPSLVVHLLLNKVQSTALDELSSVMCLP